MLIVFGSIYLEFLYTAEAFLSEGQIVSAADYSVEAGGRGYRQSLAAARWGVKTALVGRIGEDPLGNKFLTKLRRQGVMTSGIVEDDPPTGAIVQLRVPGRGAQAIVAQGANANARADQVPSEILLPRNYVLLHGDLPPDETLAVLEKAKKGGASVIYHGRSVGEIAGAATTGADIILVDEADARDFAENLRVAGDVNSLAITNALRKKFGRTFVVFSGSGGSMAMTPEGRGWKIPSLPRGNPAFSPAAADCYCGTLAASLHDGDILPDAMRKAAVAGALACRAGDIFSAYPFRDDVRDALAELPSAEPVTL